MRARLFARTRGRRRDTPGGTRLGEEVLLYPLRERSLKARDVKRHPLDLGIVEALDYQGVLEDQPGSCDLAHNPALRRLGRRRMVGDEWEGGGG